MSLTAHGRLRALSLAAAAVIALLCGPASARDWTTLRIGSEGAYPPFNAIGPDGQLQGFDIDIAKAVCAKIKAQCAFVTQDWDGLIPALKAGKIDAIFASLSITAERSKQIAFSKKYYETPALFVADKANGGWGSSPEALAGKTLGAQTGTVSANYLEEVYAKAGADVRLYPTQAEANLDLASGRLDAVLADKTVLLPWLDSSDEGKCCQIIGQDIRNPEFFGAGVGAGLRNEDAELKALIDGAIDAIRADGTYDRINAKYFSFSLY
ncbi:lysine/arginine/ornithine ABC transporter substrate-binding protein [Methylopila musalis]|uniref:Lysine/arginine/ornithine ABC transporter substrate-binding protein n=1 Tax=Methylopila musalis TaxID=1134781 RepID=A0ABW3ZAV8_9HYPH